MDVSVDLPEKIQFSTSADLDLQYLTYIHIGIILAAAGNSGTQVVKPN